MLSQIILRMGSFQGMIFKTILLEYAVNARMRLMFILRQSAKDFFPAARISAGPFTSYWNAGADTLDPRSAADKIFINA
jgi:hypothetical protein